MKVLYQRIRPNDFWVRAWIVYDGRTLRVTWPWFWGTYGFDLRRVGWKLKVMRVSEWRENNAFYGMKDRPLDGPPKRHDFLNQHGGTRCDYCFDVEDAQQHWPLPPR